jgi:hypothetical protein
VLGKAIAAGGVAVGGIDGAGRDELIPIGAPELNPWIVADNLTCLKQVGVTFAVGWFEAIGETVMRGQDRRRFGGGELPPFAPEGE